MKAALAPDKKKEVAAETGRGLYWEAQKVEILLTRGGPVHS